MRHLISYFVRVLLFFILMVPTQGWAGGPAYVNKEGTPFRWRDPIVLKPDGGTLGAFNSSSTMVLIAKAITIWKSVSSANIPPITLEGPFQDIFGEKADITFANFDQFSAQDDGITPIIFDNDGSIIKRSCPTTDTACETRVIGLAMKGVLVDVPGRGPTIKEGVIILNGLFFNGVKGDALMELSAEALVETIVHELGHLLGLDHSQLNSSSSDYEFDPTNDIEVPTMFPSITDEYETLHLDDQAAMAALYPKLGFAQKMIKGNILFGPGPDRHAFQGANVVVRQVDGVDAEGRLNGSRINAVSAVSGARFLEGETVATSQYLKGLYEATGLPPGDYIVEVEPIDPAFRDISGVGPLDPPLPLPARAEFYNGALESEKRTDRPEDRVAVSAGSSGIDIILNLRPDPIPISADTGSQGFPAVASDGQGNYLVVWQDTRSCNTPLPPIAPPFSFSECSYDIFGARVTAAGEVLDKKGFPISTAIGNQILPRVSFAGGRYLVVWYDTRNGGEDRFILGNTVDIYGALVDTKSGMPIVLNHGGLPISAEPGEGLKGPPNVASDGSGFLVVFNDNQIGFGVLATRVTSEGEVLDRFFSENNDSRIYVEARVDNPIIPTIPGGWLNGGLGGHAPGVAFGNGAYLVSTHHGMLSRVTQAGKVLKGYLIEITDNNNAPLSGEIMDGADIAFGGDQFLVVWVMRKIRRDIFDPKRGSRIMGGVALPGADKIVPFQISKQRGGVFRPQVGWDGTQFVSVWGKNTTMKELVSDVFGARVSSAGSVLDSQDLEVMTDIRGQGRPALAYGAGKFLVAWWDLRRLSVLPHMDIYGQLMTFPGLVIAPPRLDFVTAKGVSPPAQHLVLEEPTGTDEPTEWAVVETPSWLAVSQTGGATPSDLTVTVNTPSSEGKYTGKIVFKIGPPNVSSGPTVTVPVTLLVKDFRLELVSGDGQEVQAGEPYLAPQVVQVFDEKGVGVSGVALSWVVTKGGARFSSGGTQIGTSTDFYGKAGVRAITGTDPAVNEYKVTCAVCRADANEVVFQGIGMTMEITLEKPSVLPRLGRRDTSLIGKQSKVTVTVLPANHGQNREVNVTVLKGEGGGHETLHNPDTRPTGNLSLQPEPLNPDRLVNPKGPPAKGTCLGIARGGETTGTTTTTNNMIDFTYTSCEISGTETLEASIKLADSIAADGTKIIGEREIKKEAMIQVEVPGLIELTHNSFYRLTGNTSPDGKKHPKNHFGTNRTVGGIIIAVAVYYSSTQSIPSSTNPNATSTNITLGINDMSLSLGGFFDNGTWVGKTHSTHREGTNADIDRTHIVPGRGELFLTPDNQLKLAEFVGKAGGRLDFEDPRTKKTPCDNMRTRSGKEPGNELCLMHIEFPQ